MSKFNSARQGAGGTSVLVTERTPSAVNANGGFGYARDLQTELYLLGVSNFVGEDSFHEGGLQRDDRYASLVREVGLSDPQWMGGFLPWLRSEMKMRTAPLVGAAEFIHARHEAGVSESSHKQCVRGVGRRTVDLVLQRADEPGEILAYWLDRYGRRMPFAFKKGVADGAGRLYTPRALLNYDSPQRQVRFGDVIELVHPRPKANLDGGRGADEDEVAAIARARRQRQSDLFHAALDRRRGRRDPHIGEVRMLAERAELMAVPVDQRRAVLRADDAAVRLNLAGMTWKSLAGWLQGEMDAEAWAAILPCMRYGALLGNLRNFDQRGLPDDLAMRVADKLCDPDEVAQSRVWPLQFLSAYRHIESDRWTWPLERALELSLNGLPPLTKKTLIMVDTSSSMRDRLTSKSSLLRWDAAVLFALAVARRCESADVVSYASNYRYFARRGGETVLRQVQRWGREGFFLGGGTDTARALRENYRNHDRVLIITDEQANRDHRVVSECAPSSVPMYTWNLGGLPHGHAPSGGGNRFVIGGLSDAAFQVVPILERGKHAAWPF